MRITGITLTAFSYGDPEPGFWNGIIGYPPRPRRKGFSRLTITTDDGAIGMAPGPGPNRALIDQLAAVVTGQDPLAADALWQRMYQGNWRKPVAKGEHIRAMSAIDNALWDLRGKVTGQPAWKLLGGAQRELPAYAAGGYYQEGKGLAELAAEAAHAVELGFRAVKMKIGWAGATLREDAERVGAVREAIGPDVDLMIDANNAWDFATALRFALLVERHDPYWFEEPVHADDVQGSAALARAQPIPIASGENEFTRWGFRDLIDARAAHYIQADPNVCGGLTEWVKIAAYAGAHHLPMAPHGDAHLGAVAVAAVTNGQIVEMGPALLSDELVAPPEFRDGRIVMSDRPGLGIEWNEDLIERLARGD
ncbi:MAG: mandelate racemase/muconate lactonizing enzyme family protein [Spirochaetaceae bacterium]|nr:mandelate racemase/muconate lactonizing enzyme family protein [Spirochaetaceae bacterium]